MKWCISFSYLLFFLVMFLSDLCHIHRYHEMVCCIDINIFWCDLISLCALVFLNFSKFQLCCLFSFQWRTKFRKSMNKADNDASTRAVDSLINYEVRLWYTFMEAFLFTLVLMLFSFVEAVLKYLLSSDVILFSRQWNISIMKRLKLANMMSTWRVSWQIIHLGFKFLVKFFSLIIDFPLFFYWFCWFCLVGYEDAALKAQNSLAFLNFGQNVIFSTALSTAMVLCSHGILNGNMTIGDLVNYLLDKMTCF